MKIWYRPEMRGIEPRVFACKTNTLPLSYVPFNVFNQTVNFTLLKHDFKNEKGLNNLKKLCLFHRLRRRLMESYWAVIYHRDIAGIIIGLDPSPSGKRASDTSECRAVRIPSHRQVAETVSVKCSLRIRVQKTLLNVTCDVIAGSYVVNYYFIM